MFFNTTVDSITKDFVKMVAALDTLVTNNTQVIENNNKALATIAQDNHTRSVEIKRAKAIKDNINSILSI